MEESHHQYIMWMKRKQMLKSHLVLQGGYSSIKSSWEEKAFAEDTARIFGVGNNGGCIWPPRSYSCSFCKREFRSAQALGGHMNVHRRDRARLKQKSLSPTNHHDSSYSSLPNHQFSCLNSSITTTGTLSPSRLSTSSAISMPEKCDDHHHHKKISACSASISSWVKQKDFSNYSESEVLKGLSFGHVETDLSVGLNSNFGQKLSSDSREDGGIIGCNKRPKTCVSSLMAFHSAEIVLGVKPAGMEDLDLELRLGKSRKVK